jgi:hypothetical protein
MGCTQEIRLHCPKTFDDEQYGPSFLFDGTRHSKPSLRDPWSDFQVTEVRNFISRGDAEAQRY